MKSLFRDLDAVLPAHADLDAGDGSKVVGGHLGARLGAASGGHPAAPVAAALDPLLAVLLPYGGRAPTRFSSSYLGHDLRRALGERGLPMQGTRDELLDRIISYEVSLS